jgi:hypothetical protein
LRYLKVQWHHEDPEEPVVLYSEIDVQRYETRKIEEFADGRLDHADAARETGTTFLGEAPIPSLDEIDEQDEFTPVEITQEEFELVWQRATNTESG